MVQLAEPVSLFDLEASEEELAPAAQADTMASRVRHAITERLEEDPTFSNCLSERVDEVIADDRAQRLSGQIRVLRAKAHWAAPRACGSSRLSLPEVQNIQLTCVEDHELFSPDGFCPAALAAAPRAVSI